VTDVLHPASSSPSRIEGAEDIKATTRSEGVVGAASGGVPTAVCAPFRLDRKAPGAARSTPVSKLALAAVVAPLLLGPLGAITGIAFGWSARRAIRAAGPGLVRGQALAATGLALGVLTSVLWSAALCGLLWTLRHPTESVMLAAADLTHPQALFQRPVATGPESAAVAPSAPTTRGVWAPKTTSARREGAITLVDVGASVISLGEVLAKERAEAASTSETVVVMTTGARCDSCRGVDAAFHDPLMQAALAKVRLVRVDVGIFAEDLALLKIPGDKIPGFYLPSLVWTPRDGINGGEWNEDVARNIAPVLGAFVRGKYEARREPWKPLRGPGTRL
jgi:hypothetical protein